MQSLATRNVSLNDTFFKGVMGILISEEAILFCKWVFYTLALPLVGLFGIVTNIINIKCFIKMGLKDSVNVNLLGLAISDLGCLTTVVFTSIGLSHWFAELNLPVDTTEFVYLIPGWPHVLFVRVTSAITALITLERCLCIAMPLKVKSLFTSKRVGIIITWIFIIVTCCICPVYYTSRLTWRFSPERNMTILGLVFTSDRHRIDSGTFTFINIVFPFVIFIMVITFTGVLAINLENKSKWRTQSTGPGGAKDSNVRDQKVAKMIVALSSVFIASYIPVIVSFIAVIAIPGFSVEGQNFNVVIIVGGSGLLLESINSSVNIFIYYQMSSNYRYIFRQMFRLD